MLGLGLRCKVYLYLYTNKGFSFHITINKSATIMENDTWTITRNRFIAFFDIMGFKEMVDRNDHKDIVEKLRTLKIALKAVESIHKEKDYKEKISETKSVSFSDSIIFFSKEDSVKDLHKILWDSAWIIYKSLENGIGIKGAISHGEITVDFDNSLFFGKPIIDAYLLHDQIQLYTAVIDNNVEKILNKEKLPSEANKFIATHKAVLKNGKVTHKLITPGLKEFIKKEINAVNKMYENVSGHPRIYVDNTLDFLNQLLIKKEKTVANKSVKKSKNEV